jgi:hypothetical protein
VEYDFGKTGRGGNAAETLVDLKSSGVIPFE